MLGYCEVVMASVPSGETDPSALTRACKAGEIKITAARSFNRDLRSVYFLMAALAWLIGPISLIVATGFTLAVQ